MLSNTQLIIISIIGWGIGSLLLKVANNNMHPIMVAAIMTAMYVIMIPLPFLAMKVDYTINTAGVVCALLGGLGMCIGSLTYFYALKTGDAGQTTFMAALYPGLTLALSVMFLGESFSIRKGFGIVLALASVYVLSKK